MTKTRVKHKSIYIALFGFIPALFFGQTRPPRRHLLPENLREISGLARLPDGSCWLLNDNDNPPELFRYDPIAGRVLEIRRLPVRNRDWEDLTADPTGRLYIGDFGNNRNARRDLCIYRYDPVSGALDSILFRYPDQTAFPPPDQRDWNYDCEAMIFFADSLHLFSKNRFVGNFFVKHYVLPARATAPGEVQVAELRDSVRLPRRVVSGAALSADGRTLALTAYIGGKRWGFLPYAKADVFFFTGFSGSDFLQGKRARQRLPKFGIARQFESIAHWKGDYWLAANERRPPQKASVWRLRRR